MAAPSAPKVTGKSNGFAHSYLYASNFNSVTLASLDLNNAGTKFGVRPNLIKALSVTSFGFKYNPRVARTRRTSAAGTSKVKPVDRECSPHALREIRLKPSLGTMSGPRRDRSFLAER